MTVMDSIENGINHLGISWLYNQSLIESSNIWTANATGGVAEFCMKVSLYSNSSGGILFNFHKAKYQIQVDLTAGFSTFSTEVSVTQTTPSDGGVLEIMVVDENIQVYQCNDTYHEFLELCVRSG